MPEMTDDHPLDIASLWDFSDPAASEARFLAAARETEGDDSLQLRTQAARAQGLQKMFDAAHATLDGVDAVRGEASAIVNVRYLLERGRVFNTSGSKDDARPLFLAAWEAAKSADLDGLAVDAAHMMGIIASPAEAMAWNERALSLAESSEAASARKWRASLHNNIGWTHHDEGRHDEALDHFERALELREEAGNAGSIRIARWSVARSLRSLGRCSEALAIQLALEAEHRANGSEDGFVYEEIAECKLLTGEAHAAAPYFARALPLLEKMGWIATDRLERIRDLAGSRDDEP